MKITVRYIPTEFRTTFWTRPYMQENKYIQQHGGYVRSCWWDIDGFIVKENRYSI